MSVASTQDGPPAPDAPEGGASGFVVDDGMLVSMNPATGEEVGRYAVSDESAVRAAVARAKDAGAWWRGLGHARRRDRLVAWRSLMTRRMDEAIELLHRENGKPSGDALMEVIATVHQLNWAAKKAAKVLGPRRVAPGVYMANQTATVEYEPYGVVGVIGPWNYPMLTPMGSIAYALAAGNAVVFKPSEYTPAMAAWLVDTFVEVVPEQPVFGLVIGPGETGAALCRAGADKIAFTGSPSTARRVMAACAETLTPVLIEGGGKDAFLVDEDADLDAAADAALWGGMTNAGQTCVGVERIFVVDAVYDEFVGMLTAEAEKVRAGSDADADIGPITMPSQIEVIRRHIDDALRRGGRALVGGRDSVDPPFVGPVILADVPDEAAAAQEETFGPTLTVTRVRDMDEAVERANGTAYGLAATVFSGRRGVEIARRLRAGIVSVNAILAFVGVGALPFGGVGDSGFGRIHGEDGLREFARAKSITRQRFALPVPVYSYRRTQRTEQLLARFTRVLYGRGP